MRIHELGHIVFYVTNVEKLSYFYREILGFKQVAKEKGMTLFSSGRTHHEMLLIEVGGKSEKKGYPKPGFYHMGLKIGNTDKELREALKNLQNKKVPIIGMTDHGVTHSIYISDPDGNEIELYVDINDSWKKNPKAILSRPKELKI